MRSESGVRARLTRWWSERSSTHRRRIVLGSLVGLSLLARDLVLFLVAASLLALSEVAPASAGPARTAG